MMDDISKTTKDNKEKDETKGKKLKVGSILNQTGFFWLNSLISIAIKKELENEDCFNLPFPQTSQVCTSRFEEMWIAANEAHPKDKYVLHRVLYNMQRSTLVAGFIKELFGIGCGVIVPKIFHHLLDIFDQPNFSAERAAGYCILVYVLEMVRAAISNARHYSSDQLLDKYI